MKLIDPRRLGSWIPSRLFSDAREFCTDPLGGSRSEDPADEAVARSAISAAVRRAVIGLAPERSAWWNDDKLPYAGFATDGKEPCSDPRAEAYADGCDEVR